MWTTDTCFLPEEQILIHVESEPFSPPFITGILFYKNKTRLMFFCFLQIFFHYSEFSGNVNELMLGDDVEFGIQTRNVCDRNIHVLELI